MQRFYIPGLLGMRVILDDKDIYHQLTRVLRIQKGENITLFNVIEGEVVYHVVEVGKSKISLEKVSQSFPERDGLKDITLIQALPNKYEKIEYILQKGVEVGISKFIFFRSDFSQKLILSPSKIERFTVITREAIEQCGGMKLPEVEFRDEQPIVEPGEPNVVLDTTGSLTTVGNFKTHTKLSLWVGPEGGWSERERVKMRENSFIFARFGERVLRTETAGPVTAFALQYA